MSSNGELLKAGRVPLRVIGEERDWAPTPRSADVFADPVPTPVRLGPSKYKRESDTWPGKP